MIMNGEDVTQVNTCMITDMRGFFNTYFYSVTEEQKNNIRNFGMSPNSKKVVYTFFSQKKTILPPCHQRQSKKTISKSKN